MFLPWFHYEQSSGRNTSEEGPYGQHKEVDYVNHTAGVLGDEGGLILDDDWVPLAMLAGLGTTAGLLFLAALGELPGLRQVAGRRLVLSFQALAALVLLGVLTLGWFWMPLRFEAYGVTEAFTYFREEPAGYTRTNIGFGWMLAGIAWFGIPIAWIQKFASGDDTIDLEAYRA